MKFFDTATILIKSGKGGDGIVSSRREAGVPYGGPAGGNGGAGGNVYLRATTNDNTLARFHYTHRFIADNGGPGRTKNQYGADADDIIVDVPVGTIVRLAETDFSWTLDVPDQLLCVAHGGAGGMGNTHFTTATAQFPEFSLYGEPGQTYQLNLELQLIADIGLIGMPSVGKSSLINTVAQTHVKTADYHFTTLVPNLGVVNRHDTTMTVIDIPGLIRGAAEGKGLGNDFLRHVRKTHVRVMMADAARREQGIREMIDVVREVMQYAMAHCVRGAADEGDMTDHADQAESDVSPIDTVDTSTLRWTLRTEHSVTTLTLQDTETDEIYLSKSILRVLNKIDLVGDDEVIDELKQYVISSVRDFANEHGIVCDEWDPIASPVMALSAATHYGVNGLLDTWVHLMQVAEDVAAQSAKNDTDGAVRRDGDVTRDLIEQRLSHHSWLEQLRGDDEMEVKDMLREEEMIDDVSYRYAGVWHVVHPTWSRLSYQVPWGNDEAEMWFRSIMDKEGFLSQMHEKGVRAGDVLIIESFYHGYDPRYILFV